MSLLTEKHGTVSEQIISVTSEDRKRNREFVKKLIRSVYFLVKHHIPHTTTFEGLITLQIENGDVQLRKHRDYSPCNATYQSYATIVDRLSSLVKLWRKLFCQA